MAKHKRFCDNAGFTYHCWECKHAVGWHKVNTIDGNEAICDLSGGKVGKYDSPNNGCCHLPYCAYEGD